MTLKINLTSIALVLVLLSIAIVSPAQSDEAVAIFLKGGEARFGYILEKDSQGNIMLLNECGLYKVSIQEIDSIKSLNSVFTEGIGNIKPDNSLKKAYLNQGSPGPEKEQNVQTDSFRKYRTSGLYNITSLALLFGQGQDGFLPVPSLTTVFGWQLSPKMFLGAGTGYEYYEWSVAPIFAEGKYMLVNRNAMPFVSFKIGYAFPISRPSSDDNYDEITKYYGGMQLNPEAGIRLHIGQGSSLLLSAGYHFQQLSYDENRYYWSGTPYQTTVNTDYNRVSFRIGFMF